MNGPSRLEEQLSIYFIASSPFTSLPLKAPIIAFKSLHLWQAGFVRQSLLQNCRSGAAPHWGEVCSFISSSLSCSPLRKLLHLGYWPLYLHICNSNYLYLDSFACHTLVNTAHTGGTICTSTCCCAVPGRESSNGGQCDPCNV